MVMMLRKWCQCFDMRARSASFHLQRNNIEPEEIWWTNSLQIWGTALGYINRQKCFHFLQAGTHSTHTHITTT